ncbi:MAG: nitroreductase, partial [Alphaproteobacteria bacterium]
MPDQGLNRPAPEALDLLQSRRSGSAKAMVGPGPSDEQVRTLLACAARVPDHGKLVPWRFILFAGDARVRAGEVLATAIAGADPAAGPERMAQERARFLRAPLVIGVVSKPRSGVPIPEWEQVLSAGACCQTLLVAAHAMGFVANWITEWYAYDRNVLAAMGLSPEE